MPSPTPFLAAYLDEVAQHLTHDHAGNFDVTRHGPEPIPPRESWWKALYHNLLRKRNLQPAWHTAGLVKLSLHEVLPHLAGLDQLYGRLGDEESRRTLLQVLAFRSLGHRKVKLRLNTPEYWAGLKRFEAAAGSMEKLPLKAMGIELSRMQLRAGDQLIELYTTPAAAHTQFELQQYRCEVDGESIRPRAGDYLIDGGACWGDTALIFAAAVGAAGRVFSYEFVPGNLEMLQRNLALNPTLASRVELVRHALWHVSDESLTFEADGPATRVTTGSGASPTTVTTLSIDDLVRRRNLPKVDFIKMDIEGAEQPALRGAEATLRQHRPTLAFAVYHSIDDFYRLANWIASLGLGYRFAIRHFTIHAEETMVFAWVPGRS